MGTKYTTQGRTGFDSSPPPDDGSTGTDNLVTWAKHKSKLALPIANQVDNIETALVAYVDRTPTAKAVAYPTVASDHLKIIETTGTTTITLGTASTMGAGYEVTVKCVSGTTTVATAQMIDGSASNRTLNPGEAETYVVNNAGSAYLIKENKAITQTESATLSNKTLTSPVLNGTLSGTAFLDEDDMASDSAIAAASQQSIKAFAELKGLTHLASFSTLSGTELGETTAIPATCTKIEVILNGVSLNGVGIIRVEIGDGTGYAASSDGAYINAYGAASAGGIAWTGSGPADIANSADGTANIWYGIITLIKLNGSDKWIVSSTVGTTDGLRSQSGGGYIDNDGTTITSLKVTCTAGDTFDAGTAEIKVYS